MPDRPYPEVGPEYRQILTVGGLHRTCLVVELLTADKPSATQLAQLVERLETTASAVLPGRVDVVREARFDTALRQALRCRHVRQDDGN